MVITTAGFRQAAMGPHNMLTRRSIVSGLAVAGGVLTASFGPASNTIAPSDRFPVREDITRLAATPQRLARLEAAIGEMQARSRADPDDPKGWHVHALAHAQVCSAVSNSDPAQVHGCWWFLPWHRAFLAVTEWKLRVLSGDASLALPYWNWSSDRRIPAAFTRPGGPLAEARRFTPERDLRLVEVDRLLHDGTLASLGVAALGARSFVARTPDAIPASFGGIAKPNPARWHGRSRMETVPHNAIHNYAGGEAADGTVGDMTELATAALDPIFYAHHGNLDRLWEIWRADPARKATEPVFTQEQFLFPWIDGSMVAVAAKDTLDTQRLGYVYDSLAVLRHGMAPEDDGDGATGHWAAQPLAVATVGLPSGAAHSTLRITGVVPGNRPLSVEIMLARPGDPVFAISVGAHAIGRRHSPPTYPDTELRYDVTAAVKLLGEPATVIVSVVPLALGPGQRNWPPFEHTGIEIVSLPA
jgi:hypothetical protein